MDARVYGVDFDRKAFTDLYPFLPSHFDILLHLLGALAKSTGGIGLRSAIKVVQDILIDGSEGSLRRLSSPSAGWPPRSRCSMRWTKTSNAPLPRYMQQ